MKPMIYPTMFFIAASQEVRAAMRLGVEGLDVPLGFIDNLVVYDSNTALIGCGICSVAILSRGILPPLISGETERLQALKNPRTLMKSGVQIKEKNYF